MRGQGVLSRRPAAMDAVIPAKAGIQLSGAAAFPESGTGPARWIPAFAGM